ncbi:VUT family protein [Desertihabitans brevis]|uniref:Probable queuosine precursor transporter n=1 Tax=Desertihabitans brevis TaxID=2268447 RepID=A0A367YU55_9ACTN|nr:queuosine precursor transporter [Desertihabitans brevis]RCK69348.1 VUT family protein [Desertihabitans brevis]
MPRPAATEEPSPPRRPAGPARGNYDLVVALFVGLLLISNIGATKLIQLGPEVAVGGYPVLPVITDGGAFLFPLTYVLGDVLAEVYGWRRARRAIVVGFVLAALMSLTFWVVAAMPPASDWTLQQAWVSVLGFVPRIVVASLCGYLAGQLLNALVLVRLKRRTGGRRLWLRLLGSTVVGELVDTVVFCTLAFGSPGSWLGGDSIPLESLVNYVVTGFVYKVLVEVVLLPVTYLVIRAVRAREPEPVEPG